jgi:hypothetical protein
MVFKAFITAYHQEINTGRDVAAAERGRFEMELRAVSAKLEGIYDAVSLTTRSADGLGVPDFILISTPRWLR